jgi:exopolyphosphatase / guanosine-5'-triphosphate,3'-diphosphate pyrophosphatase
MIFAAIDVGSNAVRLLISDVYEKEQGMVMEKTSLIRVPLRLGEDTFNKGFITDSRIEMLIDSIKAFENLFKVYKPLDYMAVGTSALREAENGIEVVQKIRKETGIDLKIITGIQEAEIICSSHSFFHPEPDKFYFFIDVGGGSTEISVLYGEKILEMRSFQLGTVRILNHSDSESEWGKMRDFLKNSAVKFKNPSLIGTGGNINKLSKLFGKKGSKELEIKELDNGLKKLSNMTLESRISELGLRHDRADVIVPAGHIYTTVMKLLKVTKITVPRIGLSDGIIRMLYERYKSSL